MVALEIAAMSAAASQFKRESNLFSSDYPPSSSRDLFLLARYELTSERSFPSHVALKVARNFGLAVDLQGCIATGEKINKGHGGGLVALL